MINAEPLPDPAESVLGGRPPGYRNPEPSNRYNLVVLGGGPAGIASALGATTLGARVALIERGSLGGNHLHSTGIPVEVLTKLAGDARPDFNFLHDRSEWVGHQIRMAKSAAASSYSLQKLANSGVDVYFGSACFSHHSEVEVEDRRLQFSRAIIATGTRPVLPEWATTLKGFLLSPADLIDMPPPRRLAVVGATPLGVAVAQALARLGSKVTLCADGLPFLKGFDREAVSGIQRSLINDGLDLRLTERIVEAKQLPDGCQLRSNQSESALFDKIFIAVGVRPQIEELNLGQAGILFDSSGLMLNDYLATSNPRVYAAGGVVPGYDGADAAVATSQIALANALFLATSRLSRLRVSRYVLTCPQLAQVGIQENEIKRKHLQVMRVPFAELEGAILEGDTDGFLKIIFDHHGTIRGATILSKQAVSLAALLGIVINYGPRLGALGADAFAGRTVAEALHRAGENYRRTLLTPAVMKFLNRLLKWRR